jgi:hypothetical protein
MAFASRMCKRRPSLGVGGIQESLSPSRMWIPPTCSNETFGGTSYVEIVTVTLATINAKSAPPFSIARLRSVWL